MKLYCTTCGKDESHRSPRDDQERDWLRKKTGEGYVDDYWICARPWCRRIRKYLDAEPFGGGTVRMPVFD
ncbi:hypothetical protein [Streptomyces chrestomyceticus]|uniref:hypothetical protein n=1 Tax=Streptomyces chrestomyceticus TaxID=68185 RepID=UPI0033E63053